MSIYNVLSLCGGLALFLFGMNVMGSGLEKQAGGKLKSILEALTGNKYKAFFFGLIVTAIIQSSSATTVMVVGFVNSGVMQLSQAIGVIMGANVGTTVTAWILSLTGIESSNLLVSMLKPSNFSPVLAVIGVIFYMFSKRQKRKDTGLIMLGFSVLMTGMETMTAAVKPLADVPEFQNVMLMFSNPILGVLVGAVLTGIIQSSSASVGILQALSATGQVTYGTAVPIILGQNIGTCVTSMISSVGTKKDAKRVAAVHLYFNLIGTVFFLILFYILRALIGDALFMSKINQVGIAIVHSTFNIVTTALLLPFNKALEKLAKRTIRDEAGKEEFTFLDERLLATPSVAISQCRELTDDMARLAQSTFVRSLGLLKQYDAAEAQSIIEDEDRLDQYEDRLGSFLVKIASKSLSTADSREVSRLLHTIGDFERIGDHACGVLKSVDEMRDKGIAFSQRAVEELDVLSAAVTEVLDLAVRSFVDEDTAVARQVEPLEQVIDRLKKEIRTRHIERLQNGVCTIELGFVLADLLTNLERAADHCSNIAVCIIEVEHDSFDTHEYLHEYRENELSDFNEQYEAYARKYRLNDDDGEGAVAVRHGLRKPLPSKKGSRTKGENA